MHYSKDWKFFPDFLRDYVPTVFGKEWGEAELAQLEPERHQIVQDPGLRNPLQYTRTSPLRKPPQHPAG